LNTFKLKNFVLRFKRFDFCKQDIIEKEEMEGSYGR